ncbi:glycosyltransferase [Methylocaldum szegediense]|uniref:Glycosyltransferase involved in cell wall biosynthesis n=1 Tax=Methylocaldum szegediense TaxID=73780 RepID=A0ABN8XB04_9GAMM|nr:glycosyltransferase [Methylocaldum szegediense]CAI8944953.1 Glycosyltransferase involved in cell wall biosynthesis [Methylocaldum szegediense]
MYPSLHILGSRQFGGADQFYVRLLGALHEAGQRVVAVNRAGSPVAEALKTSSIEQAHLPLANQWDLWSIWRIRELVARWQPCIVQTYMGRATRLTRLPSKMKAVHIARLGGYYKIDGYYRHAHAWVGNTRGICDYLVRSGLPAERVFHIGNFVPEPAVFSRLELQALRDEHDIPKDAFVLFALGRLIGKKGFDDLLHAFAKLPAESNGRPLILLIAGDGPAAGLLKTLSERLQISPRVRWLGWQRPDPFYAAADLFVCPSRHEPLGNVILEAWNYRLPVVSTATDGALELIEPERTGLLAPCGNPAGLAAQLRAVIVLSDTERSALGEAGHAFLRSRFSREAVVGTYLELYRRLMAERGC